MSNNGLLLSRIRTGTFTNSGCLSHRDRHRSPLGGGGRGIPKYLGTYPFIMYFLRTSGCILGWLGYRTPGLRTRNDIVMYLSISTNTEL